MEASVCLRRTDRNASMGPRLFRRGNRFQNVNSSVSPCSFNGATSFQTWKWQTWGGRWLSSAALQWGHVFSDVEMVGVGVPLSSVMLLQWGHVFSDVEITTPSAPATPSTSGFNGATSFQTWKSVSAVAALAEANVLQWGHVFSDVEMFLETISYHDNSCFNGATSFQTWK